MNSIYTPPSSYVNIIHLLYKYTTYKCYLDKKTKAGDNMLVKISTVLYTIGSVLHFASGQIALFVLSVVLGIVTLVLSIYISYLQVSPQLREYRESVRQMEEDGVSDVEILEFMDQETKVDESKLLETPLWMNILVTLGIISSFVLLVVGIMGWRLPQFLR